MLTARVTIPPVSPLDGHGNPATGASEALGRYDTAVDLLLRLDAGAVGLAKGLRADEPDVPLGHVLWAYLALTSTDRRWLPAAEDALASLRRLAGAGRQNDRERAHTDAITAWVAGDWHGAAARLDDLLLRWPTDVLALMMGHQLDFFLGDARNLRDRVARSIGAFDPAHPHHGLARGMLAFGLEGSGDLAAAELHGLAALYRNADDVWAIHAVAHSYEEQGRIDAGLAFLRAQEDRWGGDSLLTVHVAWHHTLYLLEAGRHDEALAAYDARIHHLRSAGVPLEMLDAAALLWRLRLDGVDTGDRFARLADAWADRLDDEPWYAFNDVHLVIALAGAGRTDEARAHVDRLAAFVAGAGPGPAGSERVGSNVRMTAEAGLPACRGLLAFAEGRPGDAVDVLLPARARLHVMGGSHAQRDVVQRTLVDAALAAGRLDLARALLSERLTRRPTSTYALDRQAELLRRRGDATAAAAVEATAAAHRTRLQSA